MYVLRPIIIHNENFPKNESSNRIIQNNAQRDDPLRICMHRYACGNEAVNIVLFYPLL